MRAYQLVSLSVVAAALAFVIAFRAGQQRAPVVAQTQSEQPASAAEGQCCALPESMAQTQEPPEIPPIAGLPCVIEFGSDECEDCKRMHELLTELEPRLSGVAGVVILDTDVYPLEAQNWRLRMIPTQVFLDPEGSEVARHEGYLPADELLAKLKAAGAKLD